LSYHKYVFDVEKRRFVGRFDEMYKNEEHEGYDSWWNSDLTTMSKRIHLAIINSYNFDSILDIGCGKGAFTHVLKKQNNVVVGLDISEEGIRKARTTYGRIVHFEVIKDNDFKGFLNETDWGGGRGVDLTVCVQTLSYIKNWKRVICDISSFSKYFYVALDIPNDPIGFVKNQTDLLDELTKYFDPEVKIICNDNDLFFLGKNKKEI